MHWLCKLYLKNLQGIAPEPQAVCILTSSDILFTLIWIQTVCEGYQQATVAGKN